MMKYLLILTIAIGSSFAQERYECESEQLGAFSYERNEKGFQTVLVYNEDGSIKNLRSTGRHLVENDADLTYVGFTEYNRFNLQVGHGGVVDWSTDENKNKCFVFQPARGFWAIADGSEGEVIRGSFTLSSQPSVNPRAKVVYYPDFIYVTNSIKSATLDGRKCPKYSEIVDNTKYPFQCVQEM